MYLNLSQSHKVCLTPEMQHAIKILAMSSQDLAKEAREMLNENILLEESYECDVNSKYFKNSGMTNGESDILETIKYQKSLKEHLMEQLFMVNCNDKVASAVEVLIDHIDLDGYLNLTDIDVSEYQINEGILERSLEELQKFDPTGVGGRDLREVLLIQAKELGNIIMVNILKNELVAVASGDTLGICKRLKYSVDEVEVAIKGIKKLTPKPGYLFQTSELILEPDAGIFEMEGKVVIEINNQLVPRLSINAHYRKLIGSKKIKEQYNQAKSFINSIDHRNSTLSIVLQEIAKFQKDYFTKNEFNMKPLTMSMIADRCGIHESTVSRIAASKYVQTKYGIVKVRDFFCAAIETEYGEIGSLSVKKMIKHMISEEMVTKPISDMLLSETLNNNGIKISRRTVSKYRNSLSIPSSSLRNISKK